MKKNILSLLLLAGMFSAANAQTYKGRVGVNTPTPASTMDIVGVPADATVTDGLIAPRLTGDELKAKDTLYTSAQTGALVYATAAVGTASTKTANVTSDGYYWFDGKVWVKAGGSGGGSSTYATPFRLQSDNTDALSNKTNQIYRDGYVQVGVKSSNKTTVNPDYATTALTSYSSNTDNGSTTNVSGSYAMGENASTKNLNQLYGSSTMASNSGTTNYIFGSRVEAANNSTGKVNTTLYGSQIWARNWGSILDAGMTGLAVYTRANNGAKWGTTGIWAEVSDNGAQGVTLTGITSAINSTGTADYTTMGGVDATTSHGGGGLVSELWGGKFIITENGNGAKTQPFITGLRAIANLGSFSDSKITNLYGLKSEANYQKNTAAPNTITNAYGGHFTVNSSATGSSITNAYGVYIGNLEGASSFYGVYSASTASNYFGGVIVTPYTPVITSDARLKRNIANVDNGINTVMKLRPVSYEKKSSLTSDDYGKVREIGFLAQEVQTVLPNLVSEFTKDNGEKILGVQYSELIPVLTKAIQEQQKQIDELKKEVTELKAKVGR